MATVLTLSIDRYAPDGSLSSSELAVRAVLGDLGPVEMLDRILVGLEPFSRQMTYAECVHHFGHRSTPSADPWEQLSIF